MKKTQNKKRRVFNRLGMTYIELLTALALLSLIIVAFTPMLLQSYEWIYESGQISAEAYNSQKGIEEGLARRDSEESSKISMNLNLGVSSEALFENIHVTGKKVISDVQQNFETLFGRGRGSLEIVSGSTVRDDATSHEIVIQTHGLEYNTVKTGSRVVFDNNGETTQIKEKEIYIEVVMPNKSAGSTGSTGIDAYDGGTVTTEDSVYNNGMLCTVNILDYNTGKPVEGVVSGANVSVSNTNKTNEGRIRLKIQSSDSSKPLDFTYSPLQVKVYYRNARGKIITVQDYLYIEAPTIIFAGDAISGADYFTSAGVQHLQTSASTIDKTKHTYTLDTEPRTMRVDNSAYLSKTDSTGHSEADSAIGSPSSRGVTIRSIKWIDNDETAGIKPYYVMVGSEGAIYRMYNYSSANTAIYKQSVGIDNINADGSRSIADITSFFGEPSDKLVIDKTYTLSNGQRAYPSLWSGDYSDIFEYSSGFKRTSYGSSVNNSKGDSTWLTSLDDGDGNYLGIEINPDYHTFSPIAQYAYYYNGFNQAYKWANKNYRTISYILTERGHALRNFGTVSSDDENFTNPKALYYMWDYETEHEYAAVLNKSGNDIMGDYPQQKVRYDYWGSNSDGKYTRHNSPADIVAFYSDAGHDSDQMRLQNATAQIKLRALASYPLTSTVHSNNIVDYYEASKSYSEWDVKDKQAKISAVLRGYSGNHNDVNTGAADRLDGEADNVNLSDVVYIPATGSTKGSTFYVGSVHAYADLSQTNKTNTDHGHNHDNTKVHEDLFVGYGYSNQRNGTTNNTCYPVGTISSYFVISDLDGKSTYVVRFDDNNDFGYWGEKSDKRTGISNTDLPDGGSSATEDLGGPMEYFTYVLGMGNGTTGAPYSFPGETSPAKDATTDETSFYIPDPGNNTWRYIHYDDVYFTMGYSSDRARVYTNITYDGTTEYNRSYERYYWRSHYGEDGYKNQGDNAVLPVHTPNRALCFVDYDNTHGREFHTSGGLVKYGENLTFSSASGVTVSGLGNYTNHYNNDYYNVWFPGEMYNLTKIATKDGITVAVGYAVAGSSYQYADKDQSEQGISYYTSWSQTKKRDEYYDGCKYAESRGDRYMMTSTALGGIYNDGVLSAMINGQNDSFVNLLYFKDNESFDGNSITNKNLAQYDAYKSQGNSYGGYGLHTRNSVQFTAVDIMVCSPEGTTEGQTVPVKYYAVYGDNLGRAFYSLVATGSGTVVKPDTDAGEDVGDTGITASGASLVPYIKDTTYAGAANSSAGEMTEIKIGTETLDSIFKNIGTIDISGNIIIITGEAQNNQPEYFVVGVISSNSDGTPSITWKKVQNGSFKAAITDAVIVGDYYYFVGNDTPQDTTTVKGFLAAVSLDGLRSASNGQVLSPSAEPGEAEFTGNAITNASKFAVHWNWVDADTKVYAIAGRETT